MRSPITSADGPKPPLGAHLEDPATGAGARFGLYAQPASACAVRVFAPGGDVIGTHALTARGDGYFDAQIAGLGEATLYKFVVDDREMPDPYARFLPEGVHGPAMVVVPRHAWRHGPGVARPLAEQVIYELHVGTFTREGTYDGARARLPALASLGITTIELMPLAAFPGQRGWGYEGVSLYAPFAPYGTLDQLSALVDEAHGLGLSVILDVVYNHFGPAGNYLQGYSPAYFTSAVRNAWGDAPDYAHPVMRRLILDNALYWLTDLRFDGLRLDATHAILDPSPRHILAELAAVVAGLSPRKLLIAEDDRNDAMLLTRLGLDALWADDFHHAVHVTVTGERDGYYAAYQPGASELARTINRGWAYEGQIYPPTGKPRGTGADGVDASALVYCLQNHDQIGNRALGERLSRSLPPDTYRAISTLLLYLPMTPLLFMGQEWAASAPFLFFTDHDEVLGRLVSEGRRQEFKAFAAFADPAVRAAIPDPQAPETFNRSRIDWDERQHGEHARALALYGALLSLRRTDPVLRDGSRRGLSAQAAGPVLLVRRASPAGTRLLLLNFGDAPVAYADLPFSHAEANIVLRSDGRSERDDSLPPRLAVILALPDRRVGDTRA